MKTFRRVLFAIGVSSLGMGVTLAGCAERPGKKEEDKKEDGKDKKDAKAGDKDDKADGKDTKAEAQN